jgi:LemA protein
MAWVIVVAIAALVALSAIIVRAGLYRLQDAVRQSWARLDALLLERHDLLQELVTLCARYLSYEQDTIERVARANEAVFAAAAREDIPALGAAGKTQGDALARLFALAGNYPQLGADPAFPGLRDRILRIDAAIAEQRELFNSTINLLNVRSMAFPHRLVARAAGFRQAALLE